MMYIGYEIITIILSVISALVVSKYIKSYNDMCHMCCKHDVVDKYYSLGLFFYCMYISFIANMFALSVCCISSIFTWHESNESCMVHTFYKCIDSATCLFHRKKVTWLSWWHNVSGMTFHSYAFVLNKGFSVYGFIGGPLDMYQPCYSWQVMMFTGLSRSNAIFSCDI